MFSQEFIYGLIDFLVKHATAVLLPAMLAFFVFGALSRFLIFSTFRREEWFAKEFAKRTDLFIDSQEGNTGDISFYITTKRILEKTFYELFKKRTIMKRRNPDVVMILVDRIFLIQQGCARLVKDTLKQVRYLKFENKKPPMIVVSKNVFQTNPCFHKLFGIIPAGLINDILGILPGLFIIGGIFGTFLGIMQALPDLAGMDLTDIEGTKTTMDGFLMKVSFSMSTSIIGIILSVSMSVLNTLLSPEKVFMDTIERYENTLMALWNRCTNNFLVVQDTGFDENKDAIEALAENAVNEELKIAPTASTNDIHMTEEDEEEEQQMIAEQEAKMKPTPAQPAPQPQAQPAPQPQAQSAPAQPAQPATPAQPSVPVQPAQPAAQAQPAQPAAPTQPAQPTASTNNNDDDDDLSPFNWLKKAS